MMLWVDMRRRGLAMLMAMFPPFGMPALSCSANAACAVDGFFLSMMAQPGMNRAADDALAAIAAMPAAPPAAPQPAPLPPDGGPVVIEPPPAPASAPPRLPAPAMAPEPTRAYLLEQGLVTGRRFDGGEAWMALLPSYGGERARDVPSPPVRTASFGGAEEWQRHHRLELPVLAAWPTEPVSQPVAMSVSCGACGGGGYAELTGGGILEFSRAVPATPDGDAGRIRDIGLRTATGAQATGEMNFVLRRADGPVASAEDARLQLDFAEHRADIPLQLLVWLHADGRAGGAFAGMAQDPDTGPGAILGYFSGCVPVCGAAN